MTKKNETLNAEVVTEETKVNAETTAIATHEEFVPMSLDLTDLKEKSHADKLAALTLITSYTGANSEKVDNYLGQTMILKGSFIQPCTINVSEQNKTNPMTGEKIEYEAAERVVLKVEINGQEKALSFVSMAIAGWLKAMIHPLFGIGDIPEGIPVVIRQMSTPKGRSYNVQVVA